MKKEREDFEAVYSLSIRRGEDSSVVWEWVKLKLEAAYLKGYNKATSEACKEIDKNYHPNR